MKTVNQYIFSIQKGCCQWLDGHKLLAVQQPLWHVLSGKNANLNANLMLRFIHWSDESRCSRDWLFECHSNEVVRWRDTVYSEYDFWNFSTDCFLYATVHNKNCLESWGQTKCSAWTRILNVCLEIFATTGMKYMSNGETEFHFVDIKSPIPCHDTVSSESHPISACSYGLLQQIGFRALFSRCRFYLDAMVNCSITWNHLEIKSVLDSIL